MRRAFFSWPMPGFTKRDTVAWYASHRHHPANSDEFYAYCYLFKYGFDLPAGTQAITLPDNPNIRVFAVSVARNAHEGVRPVRPLYDTLETASSSAAPRITPAGGKYQDGLTVALEHPLYWNAEGWHYTFDGSEPAARSPVYHDPLRLSASTTLRTRMIQPDGTGGPVATARFEINDTTPPKVVAATSLSTVPQVLVRFSEPVRKTSAEAVGNYQLTPPVNILSARLAEDGTGVSLVLAQPLPAGGGHRLTVNGVHDLAPSASTVQSASAEVAMLPAVYARDNMVCDGTKSWKDRVDTLPVGPTDAWTINLFVRTDRQPDNRTLIAGFGSLKDKGGQGRYLSKFANGIHFWCSGEDVDTHTQLSVGEWQMLTATYDGHMLKLYKDAQPIGESAVALGNDESVIEIAPLDPWDGQRRFTGEIRQMAVWKSVLPDAVLRQLRESHP